MSRRAEDGIDRISRFSQEVVAFQTAVTFQVPNHRFNRRATFKLLPNSPREFPLSLPVDGHDALIAAMPLVAPVHVDFLDGAFDVLLRFTAIITRWTEDGKITFSNGCVLESKTDIGQKDETNPQEQKTWLPSSSWEERLKQPPSLSIDAFLETLIRDSRFSSFWFEEVVGSFKNEAYQRFWQRVTCQHPSKTMLSLLPPEQINGVLILNKEKRLPVRARMARLQGNENWVILGDWIIGKQVAPGTILIRNNWQHPSWGTNDVVLQVNTTKNQ